MNEKNTKKILKDFPSFFRYRDNLMNSLMAFGFECGDGWYKLVYNLCKKIDKTLTKEAREAFYVIQVKEKFGGLRFYVSQAPREVFDWIELAEEESYLICEVCGKKGSLKEKNNWYQTSCEKHEKAGS